MLLIAAPAAAAPPAPAAPPADAFRLVLDGPGTPYGRVEMEARLRGPTVVVRLTQSFGEPYGGRDAVGLSTEPELRALFAALAGDGAFALRSARAAPGLLARTRYALTLAQAGRVHEFTVENPEQLPDRRYVAAVRRLRAFVVAITGEPRFFDGRVAPEDSGFLHLESFPSGRVFLDEVLLADATPIDAVRLPLGNHLVRVVSPDGRTRTLDFTIEKGKTTALRLNLE